MISIRQIFVIILVIGVFLLLSHLRRRARLNWRKPARRASRFEETVRCAHCGVHLPRSHAIGNGQEDYYCSEKHRIAHQPSSDHGAG